MKWLFGKEIEIPEEWNLEKLGNICKIRKNNNILSDLYIGLEHIGQGNNILEDTGNVNEFTSTKNTFFQGDVLYGKLRPLLNKVWLATESGYCSTDILPLVSTNKILSRILLFVLTNHDFLRYAVCTSAGTKMPRTNWSDMKKFSVILPSIQEQQKIASILSGVDALIESTQKLIEKIKMLKKGLMQKLFTQGIDKTSIILSRLDSIIFLQRGHDLPNHKRRIGKIPVIGSNGIVGYHNESKSNGPGVLIGRSGTLGKVYYAEEDYWPLNTSLYVKEFYSSFPKFVFYLLQNLDYKKFNAGTSVPTLNRNHLHPFKLKIPININEQQKIASILSGVDAYIQKNQQYKERLEKLKKGLMQKLLTGQIRVKV